jgi:hypothetical protein
MVRLAEIFARYGPAYVQKYGPSLLPSHKRAMVDILHCRTPELGGQVYCCDHCGTTHYVYHSCRNRSCPQCHYEQSQAWREARRQELLCTPYFHVVFTIPHGLHAAIRSDQTRFYGILMQAAGQSLLEMAADPHHVGGLIGILAVLHTWGRNLDYHPHVHCLVTGGGLDLQTQEWCAARPDYLVPVKALSVLFRRHVRELLGSAITGRKIPARVWRVPWVINCQPVRNGPESVLNYLAGYVHRIAISEDRILSAENGQVTFRYQDTRDQKLKTMTLPAVEFIRRYLQHVLPRGFHKVRYYGLWSPGYRPWLRRLQLLLGPAVSAAPHPPDAQTPSLPTAVTSASSPGRTCPVCGQGTLVWMGRLAPHGRGPP